MAKISQRIIDRILEVARIEEVVGDFLGWASSHNSTGLRKTGVRYTAICPFHDDKHDGNFIVYPKGNCYKCFTCGAKGGVVDFLMDYGKLSYPDAIRFLGKKYNIDTDMQDINIQLPPPRPAPPPLPTLELPETMVDGRMIADSMQPCQATLVNWLRSLNFDSIERRRLEEAIQAYKLGHSNSGMTIYWQIDENQKIRTGKMMRYKSDGHRDRESSYNFDWIHSALSRKMVNGKPVYEAPWPHPNLFNPDKQECRPCYFGLHLLNAYKVKNVDQAVCIVESEKTAIIMATLWGNNTNQVWMACGGLENLSREKLKPIIEQHRRIILYPDRDGIEKWRQKAEQLHYDRLIVIDKPVTEWWKPEDGPKADIADVLLRYVRDRKPMLDIDEVKAAMPEASKLIDNLNLEIENDNERE